MFRTFTRPPTPRISGGRSLDTSRTINRFAYATSRIHISATWSRDRKPLVATSGFRVCGTEAVVLSLSFSLFLSLSLSFSLSFTLFLSIAQITDRLSDKQTVRECEILFVKLRKVKTPLFFNVVVLNVHKSRRPNAREIHLFRNKRCSRVLLRWPGSRGSPAMENFNGMSPLDYLMIFRIICQII